MIDYSLLENAYELIRGRWPEARPMCGLVCGSGWSDVISAFDVKDSLDYEEIPGLGATGVAGHAGKLVWGVNAGIETLIFRGRRHFYEGEGWTPVILPVYLLKKMSAETIVLTNAAGGVKEGFKPGDLMLIEDHINNMGSPLIGPHNEIWGPRFPDQSEVYDAGLRALAEKAATGTEVDLKKGVYLASSGPAYETPSEIRAFRTLGADAVGMSTVPEAMLANAAGLRVAAFSCITNLAAGISSTALTHEEVTETTQQTMPRMRALLLKFWEEMSHA